MNRFLQNVDAALRDRCSLSPDQKLLVAVSGGLDSMVLMRVLSELAAKRGGQLVVAHFNHRLRGKDSDEDERFVRRTAEKAGVPIVVGAGDVSRHARDDEVSIEMAARTLRHQFLAQAARKCGITTVALAHHADDQVELFFVRLLRGAAPDGLGGMKWSSASPADPAIRLVRPFLGHSRKELAGYAASHRIRFRTDISNDSLDHLRNRVRHELLPQIKRNYQPAIDRVILRTMSLIAAESDEVAKAAQRAISRHHAAFERLSVAVQRRVLRERILACGVEPRFEWIEALRLSPGAALRVRPGLQLIRSLEGQIQAMTAASDQAIPGSPIETKFVLHGQSGRIEHGRYVIDWRIRAGNPPRFSDGPPGGEWFDADAVGPAICLRGWRAGDRFQPLGSAGSSKLQDLFTNAKISRRERGHLLVATVPSGELWWVDRLRIGDRFKVRPNSRRFLRWKWTVK